MVSTAAWFEYEIKSLLYRGIQLSYPFRHLLPLDIVKESCVIGVIHNHNHYVLVIQLSDWLVEGWMGAVWKG